MTRGRRRSRIRGSRVAVSRVALAVAMMAVSMGVASVGVGAPSFAADDSGTLSVTITDGSTPTPTPSPGASTPAGGGSAGVPAGGAGSGSGSIGGTRPAQNPVSGSGGSAPSGGGSAPSSEVSVAGMLYVGGLNAAATPAVDPAGGVVDVWFTVRNAASTPIDATADFWMDTGVFPQRLDAVDDVAVTALQPGETRVIAARLRHGGQWTLLSTHVTLTPPESVDGVALTPVTRDALALMFPWVLVMLLVFAGLAVAIVQVVRVGLRRAALAVVTP